jgi:hypothetical protein
VSAAKLSEKYNVLAPKTPVFKNVRLSIGFS